MKQEVDDELMFNFVQVSIDCATTLLQPTDEPNEVDVLAGMLAKMTIDLDKATSNPLAQVAFENAKEILAKQ